MNGIRELTDALMEAARAGGKLGRELDRMMNQRPVLAETELRDLRARGVPGRIELEVKRG